MLPGGAGDGEGVQGVQSWWAGLHHGKPAALTIWEGASGQGRAPGSPGTVPCVGAAMEQQFGYNPPDIPYFPSGKGSGWLCPVTTAWDGAGRAVSGNLQDTRAHGG